MTEFILYSLAFILLIISFFKSKSKTLLALKSSIKSIENIMPQFLAIIILIGIILAVLNPETISKIIGEKSGFAGVLLSAIMGSITMMPTFVAFSTGSTLLENGAGYSQVAALISTLTLVGMMTYSLEAKFIGKKAAFLRNFISFIFSIIVALIVGKVMISI